MRAGGSATGALSEAQQAMAARGIKGMIPIAGARPFLDYALSALADAGIRRVCLVIAPEHHEIRGYYEGKGRPQRVSVEFAIQARPRGTADAVVAAESFAAGEPVLAVNADNLYPVAALRALAALPRAGLLGFRRSTLLSLGNIAPERIFAFALLETDAGGNLRRIVEKPAAAEAARFGEDPLVSMNAWLLPPTIYAAARAIEPSPRGELELVDAVRHASERLGERFRVLEWSEGVLDLSSPTDIPAVVARLREHEAEP